MNIKRTMMLVLLGAFLAPLAGFIGMFAVPGILFLMVGALFLIVSSPRSGAALLFVVASYGAMFAWPVTCIVFPASVQMQKRGSSALTPLLLLTIGAATGPLAVYSLTHMGIGFLNPADLVRFMIAGLASGAILGATFGLVVWRYDHFIARRVNRE